MIISHEITARVIFSVLRFVLTLLLECINNIKSNMRFPLSFRLVLPEECGNLTSVSLVHFLLLWKPLL